MYGKRHYLFCKSSISANFYFFAVQISLIDELSKMPVERDNAKLMHLFFFPLFPLSHRVTSMAAAKLSLWLSLTSSSFWVSFHFRVCYFCFAKILINQLACEVPNGSLWKSILLFFQQLLTQNTKNHLLQHMLKIAFKFLFSTFMLAIKRLFMFSTNMLPAWLNK